MTSKVFNLQAKAKANKDNRFTGLAYSGNVVDYYGDQIVFDLSSTKIDTPVAVLADHYHGARLGYVDSVAMDNQIAVEGAFLSNADAEKIHADMSDGFPFEMSIGVHSKQVTLMSDSFEANGKTVNASDSNPVYLLQNNVIKEVSIVTFGVDGDTSATIAMSDLQKHPEFIKLQDELKTSKTAVANLEAEKKDLAEKVTQLQADYDKAAGDLADIQQKQRQGVMDELTTKLGIAGDQDAIAKLSDVPLDALMVLSDKVGKTSAVKDALTSDLTLGNTDQKPYNPLLRNK